MTKEKDSVLRRSLRREASSVADTVRTNSWLLVAFCLYAIWTAGLPLLELQGCPDVVPAGISLAFGYLACALACAAISLWFGRTHAGFDGAGHRVLTVVLMSVGTLCVAAGALGAGPGLPGTSVTLHVVGCMAAGAGLGFFRVEIDRALGWLGAYKTLQVAMGAALPTAAAFVALAVAPLWVVCAVYVTLPLAATLALRRFVRPIPPKRYYAINDGVALLVPRQFLATSFVQGVAGGLFYASALTGLSAPWDMVRNPLLALSWVVGFVAVALLALRAKYDFNRLIYKVGFPLVALGFVLMAVAPGAPAAGQLAFLAASVYLDLVLWSLGAYIIKNLGAPAVWIASLPGAALFGGMAIGAAVMLVVPMALGAASSVVAQLPLLGACFMLLSSLMLLSDENVKSGWGTFAIGSQEELSTSLGAALACIAREYVLTPREADVVGCVAQGMTREAVADTLCVGPETVKTHLRSVYRKLDVHTQAELRDFVVKTQAELKGLDTRRP